MITTDLDRLEYAQSGTENTKVFRSSGTDIPIQDKTHLNVYVTTTGTFNATDYANNKLGQTSHPHLNNEVLRLSSSTTDLPLGLFPNTEYYVINKGTNDWQISKTESGSAVTFSDEGSGTLTWTKTIKKTLDTDFSVALTGTTATITWLTDKRPADGDKVLLLRSVPFQQNTDLQNNSLFEAESVESQLDLIVNMAQELKNTTARDLRLSNLLEASDATTTQSTLNVNATTRANKSLKFDTDGALNISSINIDDAEDYILEAKSYATESPAVVNHYSQGVASAQSGVYSAKEHAVGSATPSSKNYATKVDGAVTGSDYSSKAWAVGGTGVTDTSSGGAAKEWATETSGNVDGTSFSAKEYAQGTQASTGGSAKGWASTAYNTDVPGAGSGSRSALHYWTDASNSATSARNSALAVSSVFDKFDDTYLGVMSDANVFTASSSSGLLITDNSHGLVDGDIIQVINSGGALPGNLSASTNYFVRDKTTNTFKLATSSGGTAIAYSSAGS
mgnify:FL=1